MGPHEDLDCSNHYIMTLNPATVLQLGTHLTTCQNVTLKLGERQQSNSQKVEIA